ncbi:Hypothetical protein AA314_02216 [Archangium gephyra]|uniref:Uncharacterized protein n=1 Tax=Archangium gephyra TaxID=48 RepID=A0AAC8Q3V3_9BACT|nr:Hypothetical protein AA314_02216 [Archangium gephyra]
MTHWISEGQEQRRWHITRLELSPETRGLGAAGTRGPA